MGKLRVLKSRELISILEALGFAMIRRRGLRKPLRRPALLAGQRKKTKESRNFPDAPKPDEADPAARIVPVTDGGAPEPRTTEGRPPYDTALARFIPIRRPLPHIPGKILNALRRSPARE